MRTYTIAELFTRYYFINVVLLLTVIQSFKKVENRCSRENSGIHFMTKNKNQVVDYFVRMLINIQRNVELTVGK
jgi:hypothetical protein